MRALRPSFLCYHDTVTTAALSRFPDPVRLCVPAWLRVDNDNRVLKPHLGHVMLHMTMPEVKRAIKALKTFLKQTKEEGWKPTDE